MNQTKMKLFQIVQKNFALLGICSNESRLNRKSVMIFLAFGLAINFGILFLFFKANTSLEYTNNIYMTTVMILSCIAFAIMLLKKGKLFKLIAKIEEFFDESEYTDREKDPLITSKLLIFFSGSKKPESEAIHVETNRIAEKWCEIGHFAIAKVTPICLIFPKIIISYVIYFTTNAGNEAFELPLLFW